MRSQFNNLHVEEERQPTPPRLEVVELVDVSSEFKQRLFESKRKASDLAKPRLSILGLGYVGAVSAACFTDLGFTVVGADPDEKKVNCLNDGRSPIVEKDLGRLLKNGKLEGKLSATTDTYNAVLDTDVTLVSVGTPSDEKGACDLTYLRQASEQMGKAIRDKETYHLIIFRSTVPPKTTEEVMRPIIEEASGKKCGEDFGLCFNPEFLRESTAVEDFYEPPKTVIGAYDERSAKSAERLYKGVRGTLIQTSIEAAELVKYVDNTWHALKVTFGNEVGRLCKAIGVDSHQVMNIFVQDTKLNISPYYLMPGFAFGGSCLPKDTRGIVHLAKSYDVDVPVINGILNSNELHIMHAIDLIKKEGIKRVGIVGLTFKTGTDDLRESPTVELLKRLVECGIEACFYDPCVQTFQRLDKDPEVNIQLNQAGCSSALEFLKRCDGVVVSHKQAYAESIVRLARSHHKVLELVRLNDDVVDKKGECEKSCNEAHQGVCW